MVHLSTPAAPKIASCGDANAARFTFWRWKATCALCRAATAAVSYEVPRSTDTTYRADLPIRYSWLVEFVLDNGGAKELLAEFARDKGIACPPACHACGTDLSDPIALLDVRANRMVFACPTCSGLNMRERWEREGTS
jgi:hypothetical protein